MDKESMQKLKPRQENLKFEAEAVVTTVTHHAGFEVYWSSLHCRPLMQQRDMRHPQH
jgi:hypothetical protein